jgi:hypothetical protein
VSVTLLGVIAPQVSPAGTVSVRDTVPVNDPREVMVMVDVADAPALTVADVAAIEKSWTPNVKVGVAVWASVPLVPVIVTV